MAIRTIQISLGGKEYTAGLLTVTEYVAAADVLSALRAVNEKTDSKALGQMMLAASSIVAACVMRADERFQGPENINEVVPPVDILQALGTLMRDSVQTLSSNRARAGMN